MKLYLWKPGHNPYNFTDKSFRKDEAIIETLQLVEFTDEYMIGKVVNSGDDICDVVIENTIPIPFGKLFSKSNGKVYVDFEAFMPSKSCLAQIAFLDEHKQKYIIEDKKDYHNNERYVYEFDMPQENTMLRLSSGCDNGSGTYFKCYGIYIEIKLSKAIKKAVLKKILDGKLVEKHLVNMITKKQGE